jgi:hypothetical protein
MQRFTLPHQYAAARIETTESDDEPHYGFTLTFRGARDGQFGYTVG